MIPNIVRHLGFATGYLFGTAYAVLSRIFPKGRL
jgi:hypothetical protein